MQKKFKDPVTSSELRAEVNKAKSFVPKIAEFILVTTAPRDQKIQQVAREITEELAQTEHSIHVSVWGWEDVEEQASKYVDVWRAFDPTWNPYVEDGFNKLVYEMEKLTQAFENHSKGTMSSSYTLESRNFDESENTPLHGQITAFQQMIDEGYVLSALEQVLKLKREKWADANPSERYRILVAIASAKLKLGHQDEAADLLLNAYNECPRHKNAMRNQANGYLLKKDHEEAAKVARKMIADDNGDSYAAGILIQALTKDDACEDPLRFVPENLHGAEEVFIAYVQFQRNRGYIDWRDLAKVAAEKYPENQVLKIFSAEAVLDTFISDSDSVAGGILKEITFAELVNATEVLYSKVSDALEKGYTLDPSTAYNTALALRLCNESQRAKEVLDAFIKLYPEDENLRLQRGLIAHIENDSEKVLELLPAKPSNPEAISIRSEALAAKGQIEDALELLTELDGKTLPEHVKEAVLATRIRAYIKRGETKSAVDMINEYVEREPESITLRALQIRTYCVSIDPQSANEALEKAFEIVSQQTDLMSRLQIAFEARKLDRNELVIELLKGRVATDCESDALFILLAACINSGYVVTAREMLDSISDGLRKTDWYRRAKAIIAVNVGDPKAEEQVAQYLEQYPNDLEMILVQVGIYQRAGKYSNINNLLNSLNLVDLTGRPEQRIQLAAIICKYEEAARGLNYGYSVLMNHWDNPQSHLAYQQLIFLNGERVRTVLPLSDTIGENTVACLETESGKRHYRIESETHAFFEDERVNPESELASLLIGKKQGDRFKLQDYVGSKEVKVCWIKSIYVYAFHRSLEEFNDRFPRADGLQRFSFNPDATDPLEDIRAVVKARAEADQRVLEEYSVKNIPLSFAASLLGKDPIEAWRGLPSVNIEFRVCRGVLPEIGEALSTLRNYDRKGCVLDAITLLIVRRLGVENAVAAVCGPIYTTQSVIELLVSRDMEASQNIGKKQGFLSWCEGRLVFEEYTQEILNSIAIERKEDVLWARHITAIVPSMPKIDYSKNVREIVEVIGNIACDPAIAASGNDLLLLSDDMDFRIWASKTFQIPVAWLQPVLMIARDEGHITHDAYSEAINCLALNGHTYTSLNPDCLMHQARKDDFLVTKDLSRLLSRVGGPAANIFKNSGVLSNFIDMLWQECPDKCKVMRIISELFRTFIKGRQEDQRQIIELILWQVRTKEQLIFEHALSWLIGHSLGMPYFKDLLSKKIDV